jgi:frataxin-like iron-binding protein CyaY
MISNDNVKIEQIVNDLMSNASTREFSELLRQYIKELETRIEELEKRVDRLERQQQNSLVLDIKNSAEVVVKGATEIIVRI